jgi:DNA-binding NtrC family response regulator
MAMKSTERDKPVVLVVEKHPMDLILALEFFDSYDFEPIKATNADDAVHILERRNDIFAIFAGIEVSGSMDGLTLAYVVRNRWPAIRVILTSSHRIVDFDLPFGSNFFMKPYNIGHIVEILRDMAA